MIYGVDTSVLVQFEVTGHPGHERARALARHLIEAGCGLALAPHVLCEFIHIVSDPRRFERPLGPEAAVARSLVWWNFAEVRRLTVCSGSVRRFHELMLTHRLGRKRVLDAMLAALFRENGILRIITSDRTGFEVFGCFEITDPLDFDRGDM